MPKGKTCVISVVLLFSVAIGKVFEADSDGDIYYLSPVIVTDYFVREESSFGSHLFISHEEIEKKRSMQFADLLRDESGIVVNRSGGVGQKTTIRIRGSEGYHTTFFIDGVKWFDPSLPHASFDFSHLNVMDLEKIEVIKGPKSAVYGSGSIGGAIHVTTRASEQDTSAFIKAQTGSYGSSFLTAGVSGGHSHSYAALSLSHQEENGLSASSSRYGNTEKDVYRNLSLNARFGTDFSETFSLTGLYSLVDSYQEFDDAAYGGVAAQDANHHTDFKMDGLHLSMLLDIPSYSIENHWGIFNNRTKRAYSFETFENMMFLKGESQGFYWQGISSFRKDGTLTFKAQMGKEAITAMETIFLQEERNHYSGYLDFHQPLSSFFSLSAGSRIDKYEQLSSYESWYISADWNYAKNGTIYSSVGEAFRAPSLSELYDPFSGNHALKPERSLEYDIGIEQWLFSQSARIDMLYFENLLHDKISWKQVGPIEGLYENTGRAKSRGIETSLSIFPAETVELSLEHTWLDSVNKSASVLEVRRLSFSPRHQLSLSVDWNPSGSSVFLGGVMRFASDQYDSGYGQWVKGYSTFDLSARWRLAEKCDLFVYIENLFDRYYEESATYSTPGFSLYGGVNLVF